MDKWIPLFQSLVWPLLIIIIILHFKENIKKIIESLKNRIDLGSEMQVGPKGITLGPTPKIADDIDLDKANKVLNKFKENPTKKQEFIETFHNSKYFYLVHTSQVNYTKSIEKGHYYYKLSIWVDSNSQDLLNKIDKIIYHLHPSFKKPDREIDTLSNKFLLETYAWGQFYLFADVYLKNISEPIKISRFLNL